MAYVWKALKLQMNLPSNLLLGIVNPCRACFTNKTFHTFSKLYENDQSNFLGIFNNKLVGSLHNSNKVERKCAIHQFGNNLNTRTFSSANTNNTLTFQNTTLRQYVEHLIEKYKEASELIGASGSKEYFQIERELSPIAQMAGEFFQKESELVELQKMAADFGQEDDDMVTLAKSDVEQINNELGELESQIIALLTPAERTENMDVLLEMTAGAGGVEAMLFTEELFDMYRNYALHQGWQCEVVRMDNHGEGGLRQANAIMKGVDVYRKMQFESGVHRVQRVPETERGGRIHTSTTAVVIMPVPSEIEVNLDPKDLQIIATRSSGAGGQHVNKINTAARVVHIPTGIVAECQESRVHVKNRDAALAMLRSKLFQMRQDKQVQEGKESRKQQVGTMERSEKIRTYNYKQDRISDHRLGGSLQTSVGSFLQGAEDLDDLHLNLISWKQREQLIRILDDFHREQNSSNSKQKVKKKKVPTATLR